MFFSDLSERVDGTGNAQSFAIRLNIPARKITLF